MNATKRDAILASLRNIVGPGHVLTDQELFAGAITFCKNPSSHHEINFDDPREVVDMICFANQLLRIVGRIST